MGKLNLWEIVHLCIQLHHRIHPEIFITALYFFLISIDLTQTSSPLIYSNILIERNCNQDPPLENWLHLPPSLWLSGNTTILSVSITYSPPQSFPASARLCLCPCQKVRRSTPFPYAKPYGGQVRETTSELICLGLPRGTWDCVLGPEEG